MTSTTIAIGTITTLISLYCWAVFGRAIWTMVHTIAQGEKVNSSRFFPILPRIRNVIVEVGAHTRMNKFRTVGWAHWLVMVGFLLGFVFVFEAYGQAFNPEFHWPWLGTWPPYVLAEEILGWGTVIGIIALIIIRQLNHPRVPERLSRFSGSNFRAAYFIEIVVLIEGIGMLGVKLFKIASGIESPPVWEAPTLYYLAKPLEGIPEWSVSVMAVLKLLSAMIWLAVVSRNITWGVAWHRFSAFFNIYLKKNADGAVALGPLIPMMSNGKVIDLEDADPDTQTFGAGKIEDFSWKGWLDFTTCTECGRCQSQCPAWNTGKPLSPKLLITSLRDQGYAVAPYLMAGGGKDMGGDEVGLVDADGNVDEKKLAAVPQSARDAAERPLVGESEGSSGGGVIDTETLWSCTTCGACVEQCPVDIEHVDHIVNMRRYQVLIESDFPTELAGMFKNLETKGNPWGQNASARTNWIDEMDLEIPVFGKDVDSFEGFEYLFWVGCAGAYEDRAKKTTKAVAELLDIAAVNFLVLGEGETCTGDPARRAGNEFLFQMLAQQNIEMFGELFSSAPEQRKKIVVTCAHCFNTLYNEYPQVGGDDAKYEVVHHTQLLNKLVREKRLVPVAPINEGVTYHDPCYLGRHNHIYSAPRELMDASGSQLTEMPRHGTRSMCCGAGGARMWMEENIGKRINIDRVDEALDVLDHDKAEASGTQKIATGCPFCRVMLTDGVTAQTSGTEREGKVEVVDVAQLLLEAVSRGATPVARGGRFLGPVSKPEPEPGEPATAEPVAAQAATDTATAEAPSATGTQAKPKVGLGMKGGAKRPGAAAKAASGAAPATGAAAAAADGGSAPAAEAPAAEKKPAAKGFGMKGGAKRPGAAKSAPAADAPPAETTPAAEATAAEPAESATASAPAEKKPAAKGFGMGAGAKRPGAKRPGAAKAASEPTADTAAEPAGGDAVSESVTEVSVTEETVVDAPATGGAAVTEEKPAKAKGFGMAAGKKRPGGGGSGKPAAAASPAPAESPAEASDSAATEAPEPAAAETAATDEAPAAATPATGGAALTEEKPAKAKGFGMAAGKKRPGGGGSGAAAGSPAPGSGAEEAAPSAPAATPQAEPTAEATPAATDAVTDAAPSQPADDEPAARDAESAGSDGGTDAASAGGDSSARTIGEAGASKAKGFGIAAGKKRPGHR